MYEPVHIEHASHGLVYREGDWEEHLELLLYLYATTKHGLSPYEILFWSNPPPLSQENMITGEEQEGIMIQKDIIICVVSQMTLIIATPMQLFEHLLNTSFRRLILQQEDILGQETSKENSVEVTCGLYGISLLGRETVEDIAKHDGDDEHKCRLTQV